jgi:hypothetical protein
MKLYCSGYHYDYQNNIKGSADNTRRFKNPLENSIFSLYRCKINFTSQSFFKIAHTLLYLY